MKAGPHETCTAETSIFYLGRLVKCLHHELFSRQKNNKSRFVMGAPQLGVMEPRGKSMFLFLFFFVFFGRVNRKENPGLFFFGGGGGVTEHRRSNGRPLPPSNGPALLSISTGFSGNFGRNSLMRNPEFAIDSCLRYKQKTINNLFHQIEVVDKALIQRISFGTAGITLQIRDECLFEHRRSTNDYKRQCVRWQIELERVLYLFIVPSNLSKSNLTYISFRWLLEKNKMTSI